MAPMIEPVKNSVEKENTYRVQMARHTSAMRQGFYLEALLIDYAVIEDRAKSFLYHAGMLKSRMSYKRIDHKPVLQALQLIPAFCKEDGRLENMGIKDMSAKLAIIKKTLVWARTVENVPQNNRYLLALQRKYEGSFDVGDVEATLQKIDSWRAYRNEVVHALMHKKMESLQEELPSRAEEGMQLARQLDDYIKQLKKGNVLRRAVNLNNQ